MDASIGFLLFCLVGSALGYYVQGDLGYNNVPNDLYSVGVNPNYVPEQSQRLFWGGQGSNQVGGTGLWASLTNKFPFLQNMFGRMELPTQYGVPGQYDVPTQYTTPGRFQPQLFRSQQFAPSARDVALTDDAVIITPPQVPIAPQPAPAPAPAPSPEPAPGYQYNKPQYRLELPQKY
ncbi:uncharacterized protein [Epargyreus clarus]|uniref:uncharacterized protein n=1 Tax=Epargyreus clarus TaxID=520877 RepID=UPI003C2E6899